MANRKSKPHSCRSDGVCFHGAFNRKSDAERKAAQRGGKVRGMHIPKVGFRYVVTTRKK